MTRRRALALMGLMLTALPALAQSPAASRAGDLLVETPWARATPGGAKVAAGYLTLSNRGPEPDRLLGAAAPFAGRAEIHTTIQDNGVMRMRQLTQGVDIPPGGRVELKPGGEHIMFMELTAGLREGERRRAVLTFAKAGQVEIEFEVRGVGAAAAGHAHH